MKTNEPVFRSFLAGEMEDFINHKRALMRRYDTEERALRLPDRYLAEQEVMEISAVTVECIEAFLISRPRTRPRSYNHLLGVVSRFFSWLVTQDKITHSPVRTRPRRVTAQRTPFIFDKTQIQELLNIAAHLPDNPRAVHRGEIYSMVFALLYGLGLRVGEVARLCLKDVDLDRKLLVIRNTKFSKSRLVPFGPRLAQRLEQYLERCSQYRGALRPDSPVFSFGNEKPISPGTISILFHSLLPQLGLSLPAGVAPPCVHSLRHSFAVGTRLRWYRTGIDPNRRLIHLSTFLGHVDPSSTSVYLTITADLLREAGNRFEQFATPAVEDRP
jgi:site-specific recombinase XerD